MKLVSVYKVPDGREVLFRLLAEREPHENISHKIMPTWRQHCAFMSRHPYRDWYLIEVEGKFVGSIYVTGKSEVGLFIFKAHRRNGYGSQAFAELRKHHPERLLANIAPTNTLSQSFFKKHGFKLIQETYIVEPN